MRYTSPPMAEGRKLLRKYAMQPVRSRYHQRKFRSCRRSDHHHFAAFTGSSSTTTSSASAASRQLSCARWPGNSAQSTPIASTARATQATDALSQRGTLSLEVIYSVSGRLICKRRPAGLDQIDEATDEAQRHDE